MMMMIYHISNSNKNMQTSKFLVSFWYILRIHPDTIHIVFQMDISTLIFRYLATKKSI